MGHRHARDEAPPFDHPDERHTRHGAGRDHRGFAGFGRTHGGGDAATGLGGLQRGRKLGSADLQLLILALLAERPSHGYELIQSLDERSRGYYSPSPGMVYPALTYLEDLGHAAPQAQGSRKLYTITEQGLAHLEDERARVDALLEQLAWFGQRMDHVRHAMAQAADARAGADFDAPDAGASRGEPTRADTAEVRAARRSLKSALIEACGADADEQRRIAQILARAARDIRELHAKK